MFVWQNGSYAPSIPFRRNLDRSAREVSRSEIRGLIEANPGLARSGDPALDLARLMGIARLSDESRAYLTECLRTAGLVTPE